LNIISLSKGCNNAKKIYPEVFKLRLKESDRQKLKKAAAEIGITESQYIRLLINQPHIKRLDQQSYVAIKRLVNEINKIGVNINQIAKNNNSQLYSEIDKRELFKYLKRQDEYVYEFLSKLRMEK